MTENSLKTLRAALKPLNTRLLEARQQLADIHTDTAPHDSPRLRDRIEDAATLLRSCTSTLSTAILLIDKQILEHRRTRESPHADNARTHLSTEQ